MDTVRRIPFVLGRDCEISRFIEAGMISGLPDFAEKKVHDFIDAPAVKLQAALIHTGRPERLYGGDGESRVAPRSRQVPNPATNLPVQS